jgi:hypothetical protein
VPDGVYADLALVPSENYGALVGRIGAGRPSVSAATPKSG